MRLLGLSVLLASGCAETGAHLTLSAPDGPAAVTSFRVVLATPEIVPSIGEQRVALTGRAVQTVSYYLQRTIAGGEHEKIDALDGFAVRVEPDPSLSENKFIPFVLLYNGDTITGVATFHAPDSRMPSPILVKRDEIDKYTLDVEAVVHVSDLDELTAGSVRVVTCATRDDQTTFTSGVVWRPKSGGEIRLVFPEDEGMDATGRALDLDCDGHVVAIESSGPDCDDTRGWFHRDAPETCDGYDTNCDGLQSLVVACEGANICRDPVTNTGLALCNDVTGVEGQCESDAQCLCAAGAGCTQCVIANELGVAAGMVKPCQPGIGYLYAEGCTSLSPCTVDIVAVTGGWKADIAIEAAAPVFGLSVSNVFSKFLLRVKRPEGIGAEIPGVRSTSTGEVDLVITNANGSTHLMAVDLHLDGDGASCSGGGPFQMYCFQQ